MPRTVVFAAKATEIEGEPYLAIAKSLRDAAGNEERAKGGVWVKLNDREQITHVREAALAFVALCDKALAAHAKKDATAPAVKPKDAQLAALEAQIAQSAPAPAPTKAGKKSSAKSAPAPAPAPAPKAPANEFEALFS